MNIKNIEKVNKVLELRLEGLSYTEIGSQMGLSRQRVQQIIRPPKKIKEIVFKRAGYKCEICGVMLNSNGHIHHKKDSDANYNDIPNLQLLCISCHRKQHSLENEKSVSKIKRQHEKERNEMKDIITRRQEDVYDWHIKEGYSITEIAYWYNLSKTTIYRYLNNFMANARRHDTEAENKEVGRVVGSGQAAKGSEK